MTAHANLEPFTDWHLDEALRPYIHATPWTETCKGLSLSSRALESEEGGGKSWNIDNYDNGNSSRLN